MTNERENLIESIRANEFCHHTTGHAVKYVQANVVVLPQKYAYDFLVFCIRNPRSCPLLGVTDPGSPNPSLISNSSIDIRTDVPKYSVFEYGKCIDQPLDIKKYWQDDFITFLLGCSFTFEGALIDNGINIKHIIEEKNVSMYTTNIDCVPSGIFSGKMVVSMRPIHYSYISRVVEVTARFPSVHGSPIHIGDPEKIGIKNISHPDFGDPIKIKDDEIPVFWACGVTPQVVALKSRPELMITHAPGHMLVTDYLNAKLSI